MSWLIVQLWNTFHPPELVRPALEKTLKTLQMDYIDLYIVEMPTAFKVCMFLMSHLQKICILKMFYLNKTDWNILLFSEARRYILPQRWEWEIHLSWHRSVCYMGGETWTSCYSFREIQLYLKSMSCVDNTDYSYLNNDENVSEKGFILVPVLYVSATCRRQIILAVHSWYVLKVRYKPLTATHAVCL